MATKPTFNKLNLDKEKIKEIETININGVEIEVKQYLPINDKLKVIQNVLSFIQADEMSTGRKFKNPLQLEAIEIMEVIRAYTNITFTEKQAMDNLDKTYDLLDSNGVIDVIINAIPAEEFDILNKSMDESVEEYYKYKNSTAGILDMLATNYETLNFDVDALREKLQDKETFKILPEIMDKLN